MRPWLGASGHVVGDGVEVEVGFRCMLSHLPLGDPQGRLDPSAKFLVPGHVAC